MILQKPDELGLSTPCRAENFRDSPFHPVLAALENLDHSAVILFHPAFQTIECKWLSDGEYETMFRIVSGEGSLSEKHGITVPIGRIAIGVDDENLCLERLMREMFEAVQALAEEGRKLPNPASSESGRKFWSGKFAEMAVGLHGRRPPSKADYGIYAQQAAAKFFLIAKLSESIRILSFPPLRALQKAA